MVKVSRAAVAAILFAGAGAAFAQPPGGPGRPGPGGPEKKDGPRREVRDQKDARPAEGLERELQMLRARQAEIEAQLKKAREGGGEKRDEPRREEGKRPDGPPMGRGPFGPGGPGGGFGPRGGFGVGGPPGFVGPGMNLPLENMSPEQIKQLIGRLQEVLEAKSRGAEAKKPGGDQPKKADAPRPANNEEILKRLERLNKELDEILRSLGK